MPAWTIFAIVRSPSTRKRVEKNGCPNHPQSRSWTHIPGETFDWNLLDHLGDAILSARAASLAAYVRIMSAPARRMAPETSIITSGLVDPAVPPRRLDHRVLARDGVRGHGNVELGPDGRDHVEVARAGFTITISAPSSMSSDTRGAPRGRSAGPSDSSACLRTGAWIPPRRGTARVKSRRVFGRVRHDRDLGEAFFVQRLADAETRPSIMSDGAAMSAPRPGVGQRFPSPERRPSRRSRSRRFRTMPQWPWLVYSHRQTSVMTRRSGA